MDTTKHYIPHHTIINPDKASTKVRVVYDASAKIKKGQKSLNECLYPGPTMLKDLVGILLNRIAIVADIEKAFLQIGLAEDAKDVKRFFWLKDKDQLSLESKVQVYRYNRVPFGIISSPFLLAATLDHHLKSYRNSVAETIRDNIYVDNVVTRTTTVTEAVNFYIKAKRIFKGASMNLRDWMSNDESVMNEIPLDDRASQGPMKILGLTWIIENDTLCLKGHKESNANSGLTKREALKRLASVYDTLGLFSPVTFRGKIFLQSMWNKKIAWDEPLTEQDVLQWLKIDKNLKEISDIHISRYIEFDSTDKQKFQLLVFFDASEYAYAVAVYLRQKAKDRCINRLVFSKARLAPTKELSITRLE